MEGGLSANSGIDVVASARAAPRAPARCLHMPHRMMPRVRYDAGTAWGVGRHFRGHGDDHGGTVVPTSYDVINL